MYKIKIISISLFLFILIHSSSAQEKKIYFSVAARKTATVVGQDINVNGFYIGTKNGTVWERKGWKNNSIFGIAVDKMSSGKNIFLACGNGVMRSTDYGVNWKILTNWEITEVQKVYFDPLNNKTLYLTSSFGVWKSTDYGDTWNKKLNGLELVSQTYNPCLVILPSNTKTVIMGTADGIVITYNGGEKWQTLALKGKEINDIQMAPYDERILICGTEGDGAFITMDGGKTWKEISSGLKSKSIYTIAFDPLNKGTVYCGGDKMGIQKTKDYGETWITISNEISNLNIRTMAVYPDDPNTIFAGALNYGFFKSTDAGSSFKCISECDGVIWHIIIQ